MKFPKLNMKTVLMATALAFGAQAAFAEGVSIAVVGGKADDPFFAKVKKGIDDATLVVAARGGTVNYLMLQNYDNIGGDAANLVRTAISQGASVIAVPNWVPDAQDEAIKAAMDAGIPVLLYNSGGADKAKELGAINYIGNEEYPAGLAAGAYFGSHGFKNVICVNTVPGAQNLEDRCKGVADGIAKEGGVSTQLPLPASSFGDPTAVAEAIKATLMKDPTINGVATISAADANSAAIGIEQATLTGKVQLASFDMDGAGLDRIKAGTQLFAVDQQPWLQGFLAVSMADAYVSFGTAIATAPVLTGPGIVDTANVDATIAGAAAGFR
ncbi:MAG: sugar ABC transporter substrate-binding protein [Cypionkella sp.]|uniref:sugar ABC transporter substrate-binding protein n=1 Tax=Cypionkella sp. TaxID=2811411 RepID=UPI002AB8673E|nr:sugar ABC transporter substrate-binding protein [Cypionkella sp.]MDZ4309911.1 sugar ABC transporter substrate-binding protein [Cypionkella sp.]